MRRYTINARVTVSAYTYVDAESPEEALEIAAEREAVLGFLGCGYDATEAFLIEDADGEPFDPEVVGSRRFS